MRVIGKGDRERLVPVGDVALGWLRRYVGRSARRWLAAGRARAARGGPLFLSDRGRRLGRQQAWTP